MKRIIFLSFLCLTIGMSFAQMGPNLQKELKNIGDDQLLPVLVEFKERFNVATVIKNFNIRGDKNAIHKQTVQILKNKAQRSHHWLKSLKTTGMKDFKSFWICNMVSVKANAATLREMANQPDITNIHLDKVQNFLHFEEGTPTRAAWGLEKIGSKEVNKKYKGKGVLVAVIDTGVNYNHNDLKGRVLKGKDTINNDMDPIDDHGHGSHCAGTVAGTTYGVAPEADILAVKVLSGSGSGSWKNVTDGVQYVAEYNNNGRRVDIASMSLGGRPPINSALKNAFRNALSLGITFAVAVGNSGSSGAKSIGTPGDLKDVISVGATDSNDKIAYFSSRGPVDWYGTAYTKPDVSAPGVNITSCWKGSAHAKRTISGTSMATPHVAGLLALVSNAKGKMGNDKHKSHLEKTSKDLGETGKDNVFGSGRIQAINATGTLANTRMEIIKEVEFPINPDGSINMNVTGENPLWWDLEINVEVAVLNPQGVFNGNFSIEKAGKGTQSGEIKNLKTGQKHAFTKKFTIYAGKNTLNLKAQYTGSDKAAQGKIRVRIFTDEQNNFDILKTQGNRLEFETEADFPMNPDGTIVFDGSGENPLWDIRLDVQFNILGPKGTFDGKASVSAPGKSVQDIAMKNLKSGQKVVVQKRITVYWGKNTASLRAQYTGSEKATQGKIWVKVKTDDLK